MTKLDKERMRMRVIHLHAQGLSNRGIARAIHKSPTYVDTWVKRYQLHGHVRDMPHTGRPRSLTLHWYILSISVCEDNVINLSVQ